MHDRFTVTLDVTIRPCREDELAAVSNPAAAADPASPVRQAFARSRSGEVLILVAESNGRLVGRVFVDLDTGGRRGAGYLWSLSVDPLLQRRGIGTRMIEAAERVLRFRGVPASRIGVGKDNAGARRLYERLGYALIGDTSDEWVDYRPDGKKVRVREECWMLEKSL
jgi:ribosomal protein S18 acetylase RimI-like enzyme